jgi:hypothetical protein
VTAIALAEWNQAREAGVPAFAVGPVARPVLYLDRAEAEAAADELDGTYIVWQGCLSAAASISDTRPAAQLSTDPLRDGASHQHASGDTSR